MIASMLDLPTDKNKFLEKDAQRVQAYTAEYEITNRNVYGTLDQFCKDIDLYPYIKQHKSNRDGRGAFHATHSRWLHQNLVNATGSKAKLTLQISTYDGKKKT